MIVFSMQYAVFSMQYLVCSMQGLELLGFNKAEE